MKKIIQYRKFKKKESAPFPIKLSYIFDLIRSPFREYFYTKLCAVESDRAFINFFKIFKIFFTEKIKEVIKIENLYRLTSDDGSHFYFSKREPMILNFNSNLSRKARLKREWLLSDEFTKKIVNNNVIIDIGSNIGEVSCILGENKNLTHFLIEPEMSELKCSMKNIENYGLKGNFLNYLLWKEDKTIDFYPANETHDSSIFDDEDGKISRKVNAKKLDSLSEISVLEKIKLIKIEAEGAEPEVLIGAKETLKKTEYVLVDVGPERGKNHETTIKDSFNFLLNNNFELIEVGFPRINALFKNKKNI